MKEEWLKHIHDKMSSFEVDEPDGLWDDLRRNVADRKSTRLNSSH